MSKQNFVLLLISIILLIKSSFATLNSVPTNAQKNSDGTINQSISSIHNNATKLTCKKNEVISECIEGDCQAQTCSDLNRSIPCKRIDPKYCTKGCLCKDGYLRANNGSCVPISKCTFNCTGINEEFASCPQTCPPQTCDSIDHVYNCPLIPVPTNTSNCRPACRCKTGYYRNYLNECISEANCLNCTGPNEYYSCGVACDNVCATLSKQNQTNCPIVNIVCNKMCYCEKGYARAKNNTCIPINRCTEPQCPVNEKNVKCQSLSCTPRTCSQLGFPLNCTVSTSDTKCQEKPGCICIDGYVRNNKNVCIPQNDCPTCGGDPNAEPGCSLNCNKQCSTLGQKVICPRIACPPNGCECKDGYYFNTTKCVLPENCAPICGKNEVVSNCVNGGCDKRNCSQINDAAVCIDPITCKKGCVCAKGFLRQSNGTCVPINKCPPICKKNEVYTNCTESQCRALNCSQLGYPLKCLNSRSKNCTAGCICVDGYLRAKNGTCIPASSCPSCGGDKNAVSGCGIYCNRRCSNIGQQTQFCITLCRNNACDCRQGYYLDDNTGKCVLPTNCSTCGGDSNAMPGCSLNCNKQCSTLGQKVICPRIECPPNGCECKNGYYFNTTKCVLPKDCGIY